MSQSSDSLNDSILGDNMGFDMSSSQSGMQFDLRPDDVIESEFTEIVPGVPRKKKLLYAAIACIGVVGAGAIIAINTIGSSETEFSIEALQFGEQGGGNPFAATAAPVADVGSLALAAPSVEAALPTVAQRPEHSEPSRAPIEDVSSGPAPGGVTASLGSSDGAADTTPTEQSSESPEGAAAEVTQETEPTTVTAQENKSPEEPEPEAKSKQEPISTTKSAPAAAPKPAAKPSEAPKQAATPSPRAKPDPKSSTRAAAPRPAPQRAAVSASVSQTAGTKITQASDEAVREVIRVNPEQIGLRAFTQDLLVVAVSGTVNHYRVNDLLPSGERIMKLDPATMTVLTDRTIIRVAN